MACAPLIGIQEGRLRDREAIERQLGERLGRTGAERDRVVRAVLPFAEALARGPIADPEQLGTQVDPGLRGSRAGRRQRGAGVAPDHGWRARSLALLLCRRVIPTVPTIPKDSAAWPGPRCCGAPGILTFSRALGVASGWR